MAKTVNPPLPPGFVLEASETPPLPPGFVLEGQSTSINEGNPPPAVPGSSEESAWNAQQAQMRADIQQQKAAQPKPTAYERLFGKPGTQLMPGAESVKWAADNPEVVAATAGSLLAPEIAAPAAVAKFGPLVSQFFSQTAARVPAAFMGGTAGREAGRQIGSVETDPKAELSDILLDNLAAGGRMAAAETTGAMISPLLTKTFAPGAASLTPQSKELLAFARERKLPASPSAFSPNLTAKAIEGGADTFFPSRLVDDAYRGRMVRRFNQLMTEIPQEVGEIQGNKVISPKAILEIDDFLKTSKAAGGELSEKFINAVGQDTVVATKNTSDLFKQIKRVATDDSLVGWIDKKVKQFKRGDVTAAELEEALRQVAKIKPQADQKWLEPIREAIKKDFADAGAPMEKLAESGKAFKENFALTSGKFQRQLQAEMAAGGDGTGLTVNLFRKGNEAFVNALAKESQKGGGKISKGTWDSLLAQNLQNMILNASRESTKLGGFRVIDGVKLEKILDANESILNVAYKNHPQTIAAMRNLARLAKSTKPDVDEFEKGMGDVVKGGNIAGIAAAFLKNPAGLLIGTATAPLLAMELMRPGGTAKRWLTTGFAPPVKRQDVMLGSRLAFSPDE